MNQDQNRKNRRHGHFVLWVLNVGMVVVSGAVLYLATGAMRNPTLSLHGMLGSALWSTIGPHMVVLGLLACGYAGWIRRRGFRRTATGLFFVSGPALVLSVWIVGSIVFATHNGGGRIHLVKSLFLQSMTAGAADHVEGFVARDGQELKAAIFQPEGGAEGMPVILYIHGGGFRTGSFLETSSDLRWFADRGWLVISVEYRLWTDERPTWDKAPRDVACALAWVTRNAENFGGDSERLVLMGDSAGGNLAINLAFSAAAGTLNSSCGAETVVPKAVVVQYPAVDPLAIYEHGFPITGFEPKWLVAGYLGGEPEHFPDRVKAVSSRSFLTEQAPPTLIISPEKDGLVPSGSVVRFAEEARRAGLVVETVRIPYANHVYNQLAFRSMGNQARLTLTERFLQNQSLSP